MRGVRRRRRGPGCSRAVQVSSSTWTTLALCTTLSLALGTSETARHFLSLPRISGRCASAIPFPSRNSMHCLTFCKEMVIRYTAMLATSSGARSAGRGRQRIPVLLWRCAPRSLASLPLLPPCWSRGSLVTQRGNGLIDAAGLPRCCHGAEPTGLRDCYKPPKF